MEKKIEIYNPSPKTITIEHICNCREEGNVVRVEPSNFLEEWQCEHGRVYVVLKRSKDNEST